jgi:hypothetical protein
MPKKIDSASIEATSSSFRVYSASNRPKYILSFADARSLIRDDLEIRRRVMDSFIGTEEELYSLQNRNILFTIFSDLVRNTLVVIPDPQFFVDTVDSLEVFD